VVTFRVSLREYESLQTAAEIEGSRSLSDFARAAALVRAAEHRLTSKREQLRILHEKLEHLRNMLTILDDKLAHTSETGKNEG
jgi:uncharacterized protein (DUF1778 family)